jgi:hypothetical protein
VLSRAISRRQALRIDVPPGGNRHRSYLILFLKMVEAAGIEPDPGGSTNRLMAHGFFRKALIPSRFSPSIESPGAPSCPLESTPFVEIFWRRPWRTQASGRREMSGWAAVADKRNYGR